MLEERARALHLRAADDMRALAHNCGGPCFCCYCSIYSLSLEDLGPFKFTFVESQCMTC